MTAGVLLGFDFGLRRIGVAAGQALTRTASPLTVVRRPNGRTDWAAIDALVSEWAPTTLVVGLPTHPNGSEHELTRACREFGGELESRFGLPVRFADERYTSLAAASDFAELRKSGAVRRRDRGRLDAVAAQRILETYLSSLNDGR